MGLAADLSDQQSGDTSQQGQRLQGFSLSPWNRTWNKEGTPTIDSDKEISLKTYQSTPFSQSCYGKIMNSIRVRNLDFRGNLVGT